MSRGSLERAPRPRGSDGDTLLRSAGSVEPAYSSWCSRLWSGSRKGRGSLGSCPRDISVRLLFKPRGGDGGFADVELFVEVQQLASSVLKEELANQDEGPGKHVHKQRGDIYKDGRPIGLEENGLVGNEILELAHKPEAKPKQNSHSNQEGVSNHCDPRAAGLSSKEDLFPKERAGVHGSRGSPEARRLS